MKMRSIRMKEIDQGGPIKAVEFTVAVIDRKKSTRTTIRCVDEKVLFSGEEIEKLRKAAQGVWQDIGYDLLNAVAEDKGCSVNAVTIPRDEVIEIVADAGRMEEDLRLKMKLPDLAKKFSKLGPVEVEYLLTPAFKSERYGM